MAQNKKPTSIIDITPESDSEKSPHIGMPPIDMSGPALSHFEFWPADLFYLPLKIWGLLLGFRYGGLTTFTAANPYIRAGGFVGERKSEIYEMFPKEISTYLANTTYIFHDGNAEKVFKNSLNILEKAKLTYPLVAKPDIGCKGAGVQKIKSENALKEYIKNFPAGEKIIFQELVNYEGEVGLFYIRKPGEEKGQIFSLTLKYFPYVVGDGTSTLKDLIMADPRAGQLADKYLERHASKLDQIIKDGQQYRLAFAGSHTFGTIFKNGNAFITTEMEELFDKVTLTLPEFYFGRFDIRFKDFKDLENGSGKNMKIIEVNGVGAEATHIWDSKTTLIEAYKTLFKQYKLAYEIGHLNKKRGFAPMPFKELWKLVKEHERLFKSYPITH